MVTLFILHTVILAVVLNLINEIALLLLVSLESVDFNLAFEGEALEVTNVRARDRRQG